MTQTALQAFTAFGLQQRAFVMAKLLVPVLSVEQALLTGIVCDNET
jgi:hypothetical protein